MLSAPWWRLRQTQAAGLDRCRLDQDFFLNTVKMSSSDSARRRIRCERRFAGQAALCRSFTISRSITGFGSKRDRCLREWKRFIRQKKLLRQNNLLKAPKFSPTSRKHGCLLRLQPRTSRCLIFLEDRIRWLHFTENRYFSTSGIPALPDQGRI